MSADEKEVMGELINLEDWKIQKELEEIQELRAQIREIQEEDGLPEQSPYYPKHYFEPEEVDVYESGQEVPEALPPGDFQYDPLQSAIDNYIAQSTYSIPPVGPDAGLGPRIAYRTGERVRDIIERVINRELRDIYRQAAVDENEQ